MLPPTLKLLGGGGGGGLAPWPPLLRLCVKHYEYSFFPPIFPRPTLKLL